MSHGKCHCGDLFPLAHSTQTDYRIGVWCGNCNTKYTFKPNIEDGQHRLWCRYFICICDARRNGECVCEPRAQEGEEVV